MSVSHVSLHHHHGGGLSRTPGSGTGASSSGSASASGSGTASGPGASPFVGMQADFAALMMQTQAAQGAATDAQDADAPPIAGTVSSSGAASAGGSLSMGQQASGLLAGFLDPSLSGSLSGVGASGSGSLAADSSSGSLGSGDVMGQMMKAIQAYAQQMLGGGGVSV